MIQLALTQEECVILKDVLDNYLSDLRQEISATDLVEFKEILKARKDVIMKELDDMSEIYLSLLLKKLLHSERYSTSGRMAGK